VHHGWHGTHRYDIQVVATHTSTCWRVCGNNLNIVSMCAVSPVVQTSNISSCLKKNFFSFPVAVKNSVKVGPFRYLVINVSNRGEHYETPCISRIQLCDCGPWWKCRLVDWMNLLAEKSYLEEWASNKKFVNESESATVKDRRNLLLIVNRACVSIHSSVLGVPRISCDKKKCILYFLFEG